jgi:hypothetical protein
MIGKVVRGAVSVVRVVTGAGSHAAWWLDYRAGGRSRRDDRAQPQQRKR